MGGAVVDDAATIGRAVESTAALGEGSTDLRAPPKEAVGAPALRH